MQDPCRIFVEILIHGHRVVPKGFLAAPYVAVAGVKGPVCCIHDPVLAEQLHCLQEAANSALNSFSKELLAQHISTCVADDLRAGSEAKLDELVNLLPKLMK